MTTIPAQAPARIAEKPLPAVDVVGADSAVLTDVSVQVAFDRAARRYDLMVALNPGYHHHLRMAAKALVERLPGSGRGDSLLLLDLGCGSGASTKALLGRLEKHFGRSAAASITGVDASAGMLARAAVKFWPAGVSFAHGLAQELADPPTKWGIDGPLDGVLAAYLFRNIPADERDGMLRSVFHALTPGGTVVVQEYSVAGRRRSRAIWTAVCWAVVVPLSLLTSGSSRIYRYLWRSVLEFDTVDDFTDRLRRAGFQDVKVRTVSGWQRGILHTIRANRPAANR